MELLQDWVIIGMLAATLVCLYVSMHPRRRPGMWLVILTVLLFALPRAGVVLSNVQLPLPLGYALATVMIIEWLVFRDARRRGSYGHVNLFFLLYALVAGFGLVLGLSAEGYYLTAFLELCFYLFAIGLFFFASETFARPEYFRTFMHLILVISVLVSLYGIAQHYFGSGILVNNLTYNSASETARTYLEIDAANRRVLSSYGDPNVLAGQLVMFLGISLAFVFGRGISSTMRWWGGAIAALNVLCIYYSGSRAGIICVAVVAFGVLVSRTRLALILAPAVIAAVMFGLQNWQDFLLPERFRPETLSSDLRVQFPSIAWEMLRQYPLGCGFGRAIDVKLAGLGWVLEANGTTTIWSGFNSFWLNLFSRLGIAGVIAFAMLLGGLIVYLIRHGRRIADAESRAFVFGGLAGTVGVMLIWVVNNTYMLPGGELNFWFMLGLMAAGCRCYSTAQQPIVMLPVDGEYRAFQAVPL